MSLKLAAIVVAIALSSLDAQRPTIGLALGGGSARGFAHVGIIRWFEEHRIPIDRIAGTSMGGLVGGAFAAGMSSAELAELLRHTNWDEMFGASAYRYKSIQRKDDARAYPARLEFHLRHGVALPTALNNGQQVDLLLAGIGAKYSHLSSFDALPTPFRCVAVDLASATPLVIDRGSLPRAMRATMSLPGIFPPVVIDGHVLVDGGALNNVPADVVRAMGATVVIAVDVGAARDTNRVSYSVFGLVNSTMDAMTKANTRRALKSADIIIAPDLSKFSSLDWRRADELAAAGYRAAEAMRDKLLPLAVDEAQWRAYLAARQAKRVTAAPRINAVEIRGATPADERIIRRSLRAQLDAPLRVERVRNDILRLGGLDRYESIRWDLVDTTLVVTAERRRNAPPILMSTVTAQNQTSDDFTFQIASRVLAYDVPIVRAEWRTDAAIGTNPSLASELRLPFGASPLFGAVSGAIASRRLNFGRDDAITAQYAESRMFAQADVGISTYRDSELRLGIRAGHYDARVKVGNPGLPSLSGPETQVRLRGIYDSQDSPVVPSEGSRLELRARHTLQFPDAPMLARSNDGLTQAELDGSHFWNWHHRSRRIFVVGGYGTSFGRTPLPTDQYVLGLPFRLDAFSVGERRGDQYAAASVGYLQVIGRLPDFLGGPIVVGTWLENGTAYDRVSDADIETQLGFGILAETLLGPGMLGYSLGQGERRLVIGFGRLFR